MLQNISFDQGGLFTVIFVSQEQPDLRSKWHLSLKFENVAVEAKWFKHCFVKCFENDKDVTVDVNEFLVVFENFEKDDGIYAFCQHKAEELMAVLVTHTLWGESDGPDWRDDYGL